MPERITQRELKHILERYEDAADAAMNIRNRLNDGARIDPGPLWAKSDGSTDPNLANFDRLCLNGLSIEPIEDSAPAWLTETPALFHRLQIMKWGDEGGESLQDIEVSDKEYVALKRALAELRGYAVPEVAHA